MRACARALNFLKSTLKERVVQIARLLSWDAKVNCQKSVATLWCDQVGAKLRRRVLYFTASAKEDHGQIDQLLERVMAEYIVANMQSREAKGLGEHKKQHQHHCIIN